MPTLGVILCLYSVEPILTRLSLDISALNQSHYQSPCFTLVDSVHALTRARFCLHITHGRTSTKTIRHLQLLDNRLKPFCSEHSKQLTA